MDRSLQFKVFGMLMASCVCIGRLHAGGSGLNTIVVVNQASSNSCELGNYFCQQRQVPPQNVLSINWPGGNTLWTSNDFQTNLVVPLLNMLAARQLTNQIDYVVLSMDIPFQISIGSTFNSTTAALFYGSRLGNGSDPLGITNSYAASEAVFRQTLPVGAPGYSFLATMITGDSLARAEQLVDHGVAGDGMFPQQPVVLAKSSDPYRNVRYAYFDNAIFNVNILGASTMVRTASDWVAWPSGCLGYQTGLAQFSVPQGIFTTGTVADSLTSFGGIIFGGNSQTNLLAFINGGAAGSYGTVAEPSNDTQKFPNPQVYFYQARGFSLAESYYQSVNAPYLGLMVAEPLAAPFAQSGSGQWDTNLPNAVLRGATNLSVNFRPRYGNHPVQQVDLFVDGVYFRTLTNLIPCPGNRLTVTLNGYPITYTVPANSTLGTIAAGLASLINAVTNDTLVKALVHGDRIELQCIATNPLAVPFYVADSTPASTPGLAYGVSYLPDSFPPQMTPGHPDKSGAFTMEVEIPSTLPYVILAATNFLDWQPIFTNSTPGLLHFTDYDSTNYPRRFYRMTWPVPDQPPRLSAPKILAPGTFQVHVDGTPGQPWAVQISTNLLSWVSVFTNQLGGAMDFVDAYATNSRRFYRAGLSTAAPPGFAVLNLATDLTLVEVSNATRPYTVGVSTNPGQWTSLVTNFALGQILTTAGSATGTGNQLSTYLNAGQPSFLASQAYGLQGYTVVSNTPSSSAWIRFTFTKTNGQSVVVAVTNRSGTNAPGLVCQLFAAINTNASLQGSDGVLADDFVLTPGPASAVTFNLYARSPGYQAAALQVLPQVYGVVMSTPQGPLRQNLSDLEPRNHLYVSAGASSLALDCPLDTTLLADGYHDLTAVAYEGSDMRTQTRVTVPVQVQNSALSATLTFLDLTNPATVAGTYHVQVAANTNAVKLITLYSTGGALGAVTNQSIAIFPVAGTNLWAGRHPFYAVVRTASGLEYRTQAQTVQLVH
ncbi:MAG TPA: TIGR03790 family protein [Candidatus Acidoferrum sp.]|nr:TIGR03790 family protein [Candidatus Acidoferrum sp.]